MQISYISLYLTSKGLKDRDVVSDNIFHKIGPHQKSVLVLERAVAGVKREKVPVKIKEDIDKNAIEVNLKTYAYLFLSFFIFYFLGGEGRHKPLGDCMRKKIQNLNS